MLDLVIDDALVVDGSGDRPFEGTVGLDGDRIAWVGRRGAVVPEAAATIDAKGAAIAPGFIDVHNHADLSALVLPEMPSVVRQGVTTRVVVGNCGSSPWPLAAFGEAVELAYGDPGAWPAGAGLGELR